MQIDLSPKQIDAIWNSLRQPLKIGKGMNNSQLIAEIVQRGWAYYADIEDIFYLTDKRLDALRYDIPVETWCQIFRLPYATVYDRPRVSQTSVLGHNAVATADTAALLIELERLGYAVDPDPLVALLIDSIKKCELLTNPQLAILWYAKTRHKSPPVFLSVDGGLQRRQEIGSFKTATNYTIKAWSDENGEVCTIEVHSPKFRNRPPPKKELCKICGYEWYRGDPDSSALHRRVHKKRLAYLEPEPLPEFVSEKDNAKDAELVTTVSPKWKHREIYRRAVAFKREFAYDFIQWQSAKGDDDAHVHGFLLASEKNVIAGACAFRKREDQGQSWWTLQWIWIAPKFRRSGILSRYWPEFRERFGDFHVEAPVSEAMQAFLENVGDNHLMDLTVIRETENA
jgi:hypothetical protein